MKSLKYYYAIILIIIQLIISINSDTMELNDEFMHGIKHRSNKNNKRVKRWGKSTKFFSKWPNAIVNYKISCTQFTPDELILIRSALNEIENRTCIKFIQYDLHDNSVQDYINVQCIPHGRCKAQLGYLGGKQNLNLDRAVRNPKEYCVNYRKIQHEFLHALGFKHEHNSPNRDNYIEIMWDNVRKGGENYFHKDTPGKTYHYGCAYDYNSVMSVPSNRQSRNGRATMVPLDPNYTSDTIGIALSISECDIIRINNMYCIDLQSNQRNNYDQMNQFPVYGGDAQTSNANVQNEQNSLFAPVGQQLPIQPLPRGQRRFRQRNHNGFNNPGYDNVQYGLNDQTYIYRPQQQQQQQQQRQVQRHDPFSL